MDGGSLDLDAGLLDTRLIYVTFAVMRKYHESKGRYLADLDSGVRGVVTLAVQ